MNTVDSRLLGKGALLAAGLFLSTVASATTYVYRVPSRGITGSYTFGAGGGATSVPPPDPRFIVKASLGQYTSVLLAQDGSLYTSGWAMADGGARGYTFRKATVAGRFTAVSAGSKHFLALKDDGTLWGSGLDNFYQLGGAFFASSGTGNVLQPLPGMTGVVAIAAGANSSLALKSDGSLWGTGVDAVGNNGWVQMNPPGKIISQISDQVATIFALEPNGTLWAKGADDRGQAADGNSGSGLTIGWTQVSGTNTFQTVRASAVHSLAVNTPATKRCAL